MFDISLHGASPCEITNVLVTVPSSQPPTASSPLVNSISSSSMSLSDAATEFLNSLELDTEEDQMEPALPRTAEDVSAVMTQVLYRMERVVEHVSGEEIAYGASSNDSKLRSKGEYEAANGIARDIISIVNTFNEVTAPWDLEALRMRPISYASSKGTTTPIEPQPGETAPVKTSNPSTWAAIAAATPAANNSLVKFAPGVAIRAKPGEAKTMTDEGDPNQRVIWIQGWKEKRPLSDITKLIGHGPIYSMAYSPDDKSVCIIFQHSGSAKALRDDDEENVKRKDESRFGKGCSVILGLPFPENDDIRRMAGNLNERRRLTFARQQLFTNGMTERKFRADIYAIVGQGNVELVWLFNTGNATVVLSAVPLARMVRDEFRKYARQYNSPYYNVSISFSHDPCERPMSLITQMPAGRDVRSGTYGGLSAMPTEVAIKSASERRHNNRTNDGWQTVAKKR